MPRGAHPYFWFMVQFYLLFVALLFPAHGSCAGNDTIFSSKLEDFVVSSRRISSPLNNNDTKAITMDMQFLHRLPKILGNADPLRYSQMLPGIQTNCEYDAGVHILGCENSHNIISIEGVPVYNATHLLGLFSTFNPSHFSQVSIKKSVTANEGHSRIGGAVDMKLYDSIPSRINGEVTVGMMSSQGTLRIPFGKTSALFTSFRASYLNLLYSSLLKINDVQLLYSFGDLNATYVQKFGNKHTLYIDFYSGIDNAKLAGPNSELYFNSADKWGNLLGAAHWDCKLEGGELRQSLYFSGYRNKLSISGFYKIGLPSEIYDIGYRSTFSRRNLETGVSLVNHNVKPQVPEYGNINVTQKNLGNDQHTFEGTVYVRYSGYLWNWFNYDFTLKGDVYSDFKGYTYTALNPYATVAYDTPRAGRVEFSYSQQHQYLLNCGFTSMGLPVEFWLSANREFKPQYSHNFQVSYRREIFKGRYDVCVEAYYKRLYNQVEYNGSPLDILNKEYSLKDIIAAGGNGRNFGVNVMLNKLTGRLTGWVSYSFGRSLRQFDIHGRRWFPSNHERIHELNVVAAYRIGNRFDIGGTLSYATGVPYTMVKSLYVVNNNILSDFGEHNAFRLKDYLRLDISANYDFLRKNGHTAGVNLSVYNALCRQNEISYGLRSSVKGITFKGLSAFTSVLFSISLYYKFQ